MRSILTVLIMLFGFSTSGWSQLRIVGAISGTIQDQTRAVVPGVPVSLRDTKTGIAKETRSNEVGTFLFADLASGLYEIVVTAPGFQTSRLRDVSVSTSQTTDVRIVLQIGTATEEVMVVSEAAPALE